MNKHKDYLVLYISLILEIFVSGYFTPIDTFFVLTRLGLLSMVVAAVHIAETKDIDFLKKILGWVGVLLAILSCYGVRNKYQELEKEKFKDKSVLEETKILPPEKPVLQICSDLPKYARPECSIENFKIQKIYTNEVAKYNKELKLVQKNKKNIDYSLDFFDLQPLILYCLLTGILSAFSSFGIKTPIKKEIAVNTDKPKLTNLEKVGLIDYRNKTEGTSQSLLCKEYDISLSEFKRLRAKNKPLGKPSPGLEGFEEITA